MKCKNVSSFFFKYSKYAIEKYNLQKYLVYYFSISRLNIFLRQIIKKV